jgi:hypothetical protein
MPEPVPWKELDPPIVPMVRALNSFPGIHPIGSCGGHENPAPGQSGPGRWWVKFSIDRKAAGWRSLEFLAWFVNNNLARSGSSVLVYPVSAPPFLNTPGRMLAFVIERQAGGRVEDTDPKDVASNLRQAKRSFFIPPGQ